MKLHAGAAPYTLNALLMLVSGCVFPATRLSDSYVADAPADFETATADLRAAVERGELGDAVAGACGDAGPLFTYHWSAPFEWQYDFFDRETGEFIGRTFNGWSDAGIPINIRSYWGDPESCPDRVVTEVLGGTRYHVGDDASALNPPL